MPVGLTIPADNTIGNWGVPTAEGVYNIEIEVTDSVSTTDNVTLTLNVIKSTPTGTFVVIKTGFEDTWIGFDFHADNNYSTDTVTKNYQYPAHSAANKALYQLTLDLPTNIQVNNAIFRVYISEWEGSGGTNPMHVFLYEILGSSVDISTVTWNTFDNNVSSAVDDVYAPLTAGWVEFDVTNIVQKCYALGIPFQVLTDGGTDGSTDTNRYYDAVTNVPQLVITYQNVSPTTGAGVGYHRMRLIRGKNIVFK
jgi:hypothetical protein